MTKNLFESFESEYFCPKCDKKLNITFYPGYLSDGVKIVDCFKCGYYMVLEYHKVFYDKKKKD